MIVTLSKFITYYVVMYMIYNRDGSLRVNLNLIFEIYALVPQWSTVPIFLKKMARENVCGLNGVITFTNPSDE
jgi:hypothetical protein